VDKRPPRDSDQCNRSERKENQTSRKIRNVGAVEGNGKPRGCWREPRNKSLLHALPSVAGRASSIATAPADILAELEDKIEDWQAVGLYPSSRACNGKGTWRIT
jgi:hypothetical protein